MKPILKILFPADLESSHLIDQRVVTVGSAPENSIQITDTTISPVHISIIDEGDSHLLIDHSTNYGTYVDGVKVNRKRLAYGNHIRLGQRAELLFTNDIGEAFPLAEDKMIISMDPETGPVSDIQKKITLEEAGFEYRGASPYKEPADERHGRYLSALYQVNQTMTEVFEPRELASRVLDLIFQIFPIDRAAVILSNEQLRSLQPIAFKAKAKSEGSDPINMSQTILGKVVFEKSAILAKDTYLDERFKNVSSIMRKRIRSVMCVPLHTKGRILGALYADSLEAPGIFSEDDLHLLFAVAGALANAIENALLVDRIKEDERKLGTLERYLPSAVVEHLLETQDSAQLGGKNASISILFADIRGFSSLTEKIEPMMVVSLLNEYFTSMSEVVFEHGGTLGEYIGDEIMAYFGAPFERDDHAILTISVAIKMMETMKSLKKQWQGSGSPSFDVGIGIATGPVIAGNIGSIQQMKYTVIGNAVNLASRLCSRAQPGQILISSDTYKKAGEPSYANFLEKASIPGILKLIEIFEARP